MLKLGLDEGGAGEKVRETEEEGKKEKERRNEMKKGDGRGQE